MTLIRELISIPEQVQDGDFVLKLTQGISGDTTATVDDYVVTEQLKGAFDQALGLVASAVADNSSKAVYLQGSFGSGKSHFMAMLHLLLSHDTYARSKPELHGAINRWSAQLDGKKFLLVPVHFLGAQSMEQKILGGYVETVQALHPGAALPSVFLGDAIVAAELPTMRARIGDQALLDGLNGSAGDDDWGDFGSTWTTETVQAAMAAPALDPQRQNLVAAYIAAFRESTVLESATSGKGFIDLDRGLAAISTHAQTLGYAGIVLFLDELILWLASNIGDLNFVQSESQKLTKLVEATAAGRPVPIVSFVARQRDLRELVGDHIAGNEEVALADNLELQQGRFGRIELSSGNLPVVARQRLLKPNDDAAANMMRGAVDQALGNRDDVRRQLLGSDADAELFRTVYPFSPALVHALIDVSEALQRERTALKVMLQLLVDRRDDLTVGEIIPVGDLWDVVASRDEPFSSELKAMFETAKKLWRTKLEPALRAMNNVTDDTPADAPARQTLANDSRLIKTVLLAALVPEVEAFKGLDASRLAALNWGSITSPIPGNETQLVANKLKRLQSNVGELMVSDDPVNPTVQLRLANVDTEDIINRAAESFDNDAARRSKIRDLISRATAEMIETEQRSTFTHQWRGTSRDVDVVYGNIRDSHSIADALLAANGDTPKLVIDYPFDETGRSPEDDLERLDAWTEHHQPSPTVCWLPSFFNTEGLRALRRYVAVDEVLKLDRFEQNTSHLSATQRAEAKPILDSLRTQLGAQLREAVLVAYGVVGGTNPYVDPANSLNFHFRSLDASLVIRPTTKPGLDDAVGELCDQIFDARYPGHPRFDNKVTASQLKTTWIEIRQALAHPDGRINVEQAHRPALRNVASALELGRMHESHFQLGDYWRTQLDRHLAANRADGSHPTVDEVRGWIDGIAGGPRGLEPHIADLIVLTVAAQTDHRLVHRNVLGSETYSGDVGRVMPGEIELVPEILPDATLWRTAAGRAALLFGITVHDRVTGPELASLANQVRARAADLKGAAETLADVLGGAYREWGLAAGKRIDTARAGRDLVTALAQADDNGVVDVLANFEAPSSDDATAKSLDNGTRGHHRHPQRQPAALERGPSRRRRRRRRGTRGRRDRHPVRAGRHLDRSARATAHVAGTGPTPPPPPEPRPGEQTHSRRITDESGLTELVDELRGEVEANRAVNVTWTVEGGT